MPGRTRAAIYAGGAYTDATNRLQYAPQGAVTVMKLGNGLWEHTTFNNRLQPMQIGLGTSSTDSSILSLTNSYGTTNNNGNLQSVSYAGGGLSYTQTFGYDELNRLTTSQEGSSWSQTNSYDQYGNRSVPGSGLSFSTSNNRITTAGYSYDAAGNLTNDSTLSYVFDAENKIKQVNSETDVYRYDGDGNRVRKNFTSGEKVRMVYSGGQLIAEYDLSTGSLKEEYVYGAKGLIATIEPSIGTKYTTSDHLSTPRVVTNSSGSSQPSRLQAVWRRAWREHWRSHHGHGFQRQRRRPSAVEFAYLELELYGWSTKGTAGLDLKRLAGLEVRM